MRISFVRKTLLAGLLLCAAPHALGDASFVVSNTVGRINVERLATLEYPWGMALLPDGRLLVTEKPGRLRIFADGELSEPLEGVPTTVHRPIGEQGGLLDVAIDPDFSRNRLVYLSYSEPAQADDDLRGGAVARGRLEDDALHDVEVIWRQAPKTIRGGHYGHRLVFADDGTLFITSGDRMRSEYPQDLESNLGKVVRIKPDGSIPEDNPFVDRDDALDDIWSYGHRNILSAAIDPASGLFWTLEMGPRGGDELNFIKRELDYGWPQVSDGIHYDGRPIPDHATREEFEAPVYSWTPVISPSGAHFYTGDLFTEWRGSLLVGGLSSRALIRLSFDGDQLVNEERVDMARRIRDVLQTPDGAILLLVDAREGELLRLTPAKEE